MAGSVDVRRTRAGQNLSAGAQAAYRRAMSALEPYRGEDARVVADYGKLNATLNATTLDGDADAASTGDGGRNLSKSDRLADQLAKVSKAEMDVGWQSEGDRAMTANATREQQQRYLDSVRR